MSCDENKYLLHLNSFAGLLLITWAFVIYPNSWIYNYGILGIWIVALSIAVSSASAIITEHQQDHACDNAGIKETIDWFHLKRNQLQERRMFEILCFAENMRGCFCQFIEFLNWCRLLY
jgi:hypothetical protein